MDRLPLEMLQQILACLYDLKSLRNAALSSRILFNAFKSAEVLITSSIFLRQIHYSVLPEAIIVNQSWSIRRPSLAEAVEFAKKLKHREPVRTKWNIADAWPLVQFHEKVSYLASQAAHEAFACQPRLLTKRVSPVPTCGEMCRFERAIYRFQLYCNMAGDRLEVHETGHLNIFLECFATWENEQLACIREFFVRMVSRPFNCLVEHDVTWGYWRVGYIDKPWSEYALEIMCDGIERIYSLSQALNYTQLHALLSGGEERENTPLRVSGFVFSRLEKDPNPLVPTHIPLMGMQAKHRKLLYGKPFYEDPDPGPMAMWEWMNRGRHPGNTVSNLLMIAHRQWAYPFWDLSRLQAARLLGDFWTYGLWPKEDPELEQYKEPERLARLEASREERRSIRIAGGTGFYSPQDKSRIKWDVRNKIVSGTKVAAG
ncbi:hypothetical protein F5Y12DRAFT_747410 [Xylaria sp. FL1777]|nr:hypothetical protein F5Y12DRAFT_747410 [Xylaria sp. FL1777]